MCCPKVDKRKVFTLAMEKHEFFDFHKAKKNLKCSSILASRKKKAYIENNLKDRTIRSRRHSPSRETVLRVLIYLWKKDNVFFFLMLVRRKTDCKAEE